jgi:long-chain fatty acid transport protein
MISRIAGRLLLPVLLGLLLTPARAAGQIVFESTGERALGMAGAFVAVANDSTATYWNPAGLAAGGPAGMTIGVSRFQFGNQAGEPLPWRGRRNANLTSLGAWPLGLSYGSFQATTLVPGPDGVGTVVENVRATQYGASLLQSVLPGLIVGSTFKMIRADATGAAADGATVADALEAGAKLRGHRETLFDLDLGIMATSDVMRIGLTVKNLKSPTIGGLTSLNATLPRQARLGLAVTPSSGLTLAMDLDLNTVDLVGGQRRMGAFGGEIALGSRLSARSGIRWSLVDEKRPTAALGLSISPRRGMWLDSHYAKGRLADDWEFGVALRAGL